MNVMNQNEFVELAVDQVEQLLYADELNVVNELAVLYALCRWLMVSCCTNAMSMLYIIVLYCIYAAFTMC